MGTFVISFVGCFQEAHVGQSSLLTHYMGTVPVNKATEANQITRQKHLCTNRSKNPMILIPNG